MAYSTDTVLSKTAYQTYDPGESYSSLTGDTADSILNISQLVQALTFPIAIPPISSSNIPKKTLPPSAGTDELSLCRRSYGLKRVLDIMLVLATAIFWLPLCLIVAAAIWLEDGAAPLFIQQRIGRNGKSFRIWKFRTMVPEAGRILREKMLQNGMVCHNWNETYKLKQDPRITRIGRLLRRYSIDELPQLVNVLRGDMSLVGPRPLPPYHHRRLSPATRTTREKTLPGLTGLWQVSGRSDIGNRGMELWDPFYVRNWSFMLDLLILLRTVRVVFNARGAY